MTVTFNHTIVSFMTVPLDHGVALDFATADGPISPQQINHNDGGRGIYLGTLTAALAARPIFSPYRPQEVQSARQAIWAAHT